MKEKTLATASVFVATLASLCCIGPVTAAVFGLGAFSAATVFESGRPYLLTAAVALLGGAFYLTYRRRPTEQCKGDACLVVEHKSKRLLLWVIAATVAVLVAFPYYSEIIWKSAVTTSAATSSAGRPTMLASSSSALIANGTHGSLDADKAAKLENVVYSVEGMTCPSCAFGIQATLSRQDGIEQVEILYDDETARVAYDPAQITSEQVSAAFEELGYKVTSKSRS